MSPDKLNFCAKFLIQVANKPPRVPSSNLFSSVNQPRETQIFHR